MASEYKKTEAFKKDLEDKPVTSPSPSMHCLVRRALLGPHTG
jgi:hypothetical protein